MFPQEHPKSPGQVLENETMCNLRSYSYNVLGGRSYLHTMTVEMPNRGQVPPFFEEKLRFFFFSNSTKFTQALVTLYEVNKQSKLCITR